MSIPQRPRLMPRAAALALALVVPFALFACGDGGGAQDHPQRVGGDHDAGPRDGVLR